MKAKPPYLTAATEARESLTRALADAAALLPEGLRTRHWVACKTSPNAWESVRLWYDTQPDDDPEIEAVLLHLQQLQRALGCLAIVLEPVPTTPPDLSLPKTRRRF